MSSPADSQILTEGHVAALEEILLCDGEKNSSKYFSLEVLYSCSNKKAFLPSEFHAQCDGKGPTISVMKILDDSQQKKSEIFGGYATVPWTSSGTWFTDPTTTLFSFDMNSEDASAWKINPGPVNAVFCHPTYGPTFGSGHDLAFFPASAVKVDSRMADFKLAKGAGHAAFLPNGEATYQPQQFIFEVLLVRVLEGSTNDRIWSSRLNINWTAEEWDSVRSEVLSYKPPTGLQKVNLLLFGGVGVGKSSIVASLDSIIEGRISRMAIHGTGTGSLTKQLTKYEFSSVEFGETNFQLWDAMGWSKSDYNSGELGMLLNGHLPDGFDLSQRAIGLLAPGVVAKPSLAQKVHCMILVVPCELASDAAYLERMNQMRDVARQYGVPTLIYLSKIDQYDSDVIGSDIMKTFESKKLARLVKKLASESGLGGAKDIFPVKSYSSETEPAAQVAVLLFGAIRHALFAATDFLRAQARQGVVNGALGSAACGIVGKKVVAKANFRAVQNDELQLTRGFMYFVEKDCGDGWGFGRIVDMDYPESSEGSDKSSEGYFPLSHVEAVSASGRRAPPLLEEN